MARPAVPTPQEKRERARQRLLETVQRLGPETLFEFIPNNMAAGPCVHCLAAKKGTYTFADAPLAPLADCPHPDQCVGYHRVSLTFD